MRLTSCSLLITVFLYLLHGSSATQQCNIQNFAMHGFLPCGNKFANSTSLSATVSFNPNISAIVLTTLDELLINLTDADKEIAKVFPNLNIAKIIELGLAVEPYVSYAIADIIQGFGLTSADLAKLKLPAILANRDQLIALYQSYFQLSCNQDLARPLITCLDDWMKKNCDEGKDKTQWISKVFSTMADYYCDKKKTWEISTKNKLDADFGTVYAGPAKYFGIYKDASNPYIFNISQSSLFMNMSAINSLGAQWTKRCKFTIDNLIFEIDSLLNDNSTVGAGDVVDRAYDMVRKLTSCTLREWYEFDGNFMKNYSKFMDHLQFLSKRYSLGELKWHKTNLGDKRATVVVYGDPHMITYKLPKPVTCSAFGESVYLTNSFFEMKGTATPACASCEATYVTQVLLKFQNGMSYNTSETLSTTLVSFGNSTGNITIETLGSSVRITDMTSGAVFLLGKYRHTYMITVRMAVDLFENSMGLLINGCPEALNITVPSGSRRKRDTCTDACSKAPEAFRETCVFDCRVTGDAGVVNISQQAESLQLKVTEEDARIQLALKIDTPELVPNAQTSTYTPADNKGRITVGSMALILSMMLLPYLWII